MTSSMYSMSPPIGNPDASRDTLTPRGSNTRARKSAVASPSTFGLVARMISSTPATRDWATRHWWCAPCLVRGGHITEKQLVALRDEYVAELVAQASEDPVFTAALGVAAARVSAATP